MRERGEDYIFGTHGTDKRSIFSMVYIITKHYRHNKIQGLATVEIVDPTQTMSSSTVNIQCSNRGTIKSNYKRNRDKKVSTINGQKKLLDVHICYHFHHLQKLSRCIGCTQ